MNPWDDDGWADRGGTDRRDDPARRKRPTSSWGCALAAIVGSVTVIVVAIIVIKLLASLINVGELMP